MSWTVPPIWLCAIWLLWLLQALWAWHNCYKFRRLARMQGMRDDRREIYYMPPAAVIVPVKGVDERFAEHLEALLHQEYGAYRVILVVESADDPAFAVITRRLAESSPTRAELVVAGPAEDCGQKVWNLQAALDRLEEEDEVLVFADADAVPDAQWLERLVWPLHKKSVGVTTGYRWMVPDDTHWASAFASVINGSVATLAGPNRRNHAWGGSMAVLNERFAIMQVEKYWHGALSDDYQMTRAVGRAGYRVYFLPFCLVSSPVQFTWRSLWRFARRQYVITRMHAPWLWLAAAGGTGLYTAACLSAVAALALGVGWAAPVIAAVYAMDVMRGRMRGLMVKQVLGEATAARLTQALRLDRYATPLWMALHLVLVLGSAIGRRIEWAGLTYLLRGPQQVQILERRGEGTKGQRDEGDQS